MNATQLKLAKIQAQISLIEGSQDIFSEMSDLKELRQLQEDLKEFIQIAKEAGIENLNPLATINQYIVELDQKIEETLNVATQFQETFGDYFEDKLCKDELPDRAELQKCLHQLEATGERFKFFIDDTLEYLKTHELGFACLEEEIIDIWSLGSIAGDLAPLTDEKMRILNAIHGIQPDEDIMPLLPGYNKLHDELERHLCLATEQGKKIEEAKALYFSGELFKAETIVEKCEQTNYGTGLKQIAEAIQSTIQKLEAIRSSKQLRKFHEYFHENVSTEISKNTELAIRLEALEQKLKKSRRKKLLVLFVFAIIIIAGAALIPIRAHLQELEAIKIEEETALLKKEKEQEEAFLKKVDDARKLSKITNYDLNDRNISAFSDVDFAHLLKHADTYLNEIIYELEQKTERLEKLKRFIRLVETRTNQVRQLSYKLTPAKVIKSMESYADNTRTLLELIKERDKKFYTDKRVSDAKFSELFEAIEVRYPSHQVLYYDVYVTNGSLLANNLELGTHYYFPLIPERVQKSEEIDRLISNGLNGVKSYRQFNLADLKNKINEAEEKEQYLQSRKEDLNSLQQLELFKRYGSLNAMKSQKLKLESKTSELRITRDNVIELGGAL